MARAAVIIPVFDRATLTAQCVSALLEQGVSGVVLVNDGSTDATATMLAGFGGRIQVVTHSENRGFAESCNSGARQSRSEFLVFLNNDTTPAPGWLDALEHYADEHPQVAAVGGKLVYPNGTIQHAGVVICQDLYPRHIYTGFPADHPAVNKSRRFQVVTGACMLVRRELFLQVGGFDTAFRNGFEDVDLCLRLGEKGHEVHYCARSVVEHLESASPGRFRQEGENVRLYRERWLKRVCPDELEYYLEDGLLRLSHEGRYPLRMQVCPMLATLQDSERKGALENALQARTRELAELQRENLRLRLALGTTAEKSPELRYQQLRWQIRETVEQFVPAGGTVLVTSKGDGALLDLPKHRAWHFPQTEHGSYGGHHPADSGEAIAALEQLQGKGATHLVIPATSLWWLEHYEGFRQHLEEHCTLLETPRDVCVIYQLSRHLPETAALPAAQGEPDFQRTTA